MRKVWIVIVGLLIGGLLGLYSFGFLAWGGDEKQNLQAQLIDATRDWDLANTKIRVLELEAEKWFPLRNKAQERINSINTKLKALTDKDIPGPAEKKGEK